MAEKVFTNLDDLQQYGRQVCKRAAGAIRDDLYDSAQNAMTAFYADYQPKWYKRHYYNFEQRSINKYYANNHGSVYHGGVDLSTERMVPFYQDPVYEVFDLVWHGFHGSPAKTTLDIRPVMRPSPIELVEREQQNIVNNIQGYIDNAL